MFCYLIMSLAASSVNAKQAYTLATGEALSDPTQPYVGKRSVRAKTNRRKLNFTLNYIMSADDNRRAMVNGKPVHEGDHISGARVSKIDSDSVTLIVDGRRTVLRLNSVKNIRKN